MFHSISSVAIKEEEDAAGKFHPAACHAAHIWAKSELRVFDILDSDHSAVQNSIETLTVIWSNFFSFKLTGYAFD